jgi:hypothetical protein
MNSIYDWVSMLLFGGIVVLFLQRSMSTSRSSDKIYHYIPPALGCAAGNYLGNNDHRTAGAAVLILVVGYLIFYMKPFDNLEK